MSRSLLQCSRLFSSTKRPSVVRLFSSKQGEDGGNDDGNKTGSAKDRLNALLDSIMKESSKREMKDVDSKPSIEFKLAKPVKEKAKNLATKDAGPVNAEEGGESISSTVLKAVKQVAENIPGDPAVIESELVQKLKSQNNKINLSDVFAGMKIDRTKKTDRSLQSHSLDMLETSRAERVRTMLEQRRPRQHQYERGQKDGRDFQRQRRKPVGSQGHSRIDLFGAPGLGIFSITPKDPPSNVPVLSTWDRIHQRELKLAVTHPPANGFQEMILLTQQGKLWKFPIDNEQGLEDEAKVPFHEHVFLEPLIENWCPKRGPVRHFMELVCVALSKNSFLSAIEKREHLEWYHQYFLSKASIIKEVGAGEIK